MPHKITNTIHTGKSLSGSTSAMKLLEREANESRKFQNHFQVTLSFSKPFFSHINISSSIRRCIRICGELGRINTGKTKCRAD